MRITSCLVALLLPLALTFAGCQRPGAPRPEREPRVEAEERAIERLVQRLAQATNTRDFDAFRKGLTDDWTYFASGGSAVDFEGFRELISGWTALEIELAEVRAHLSGDGGLAWTTFSGRLRGQATGEFVDRRLRFTGILYRAGTEWELRHLQSTIVPPR